VTSMERFMSALRSLAIKIPLISHFLTIHDDIHEIKRFRAVRDILIENYVCKHMKENSKYQDPLKLNRYEYPVYSQNGEDGIIEEIFNRIGSTNKFFVEFGAWNGLQNNTTYLLLKDWRGLWIEFEPSGLRHIERKFVSLIEKKQLLIKKALVTPENIDALLREAGAPRVLDLLSIDIDGNDYWVWKALKEFQPRVLVIEYNALFRSELPWVMKYTEGYHNNRTSHFGASLKSLENLGKEKGYELVGCDFHGVNAFFVRSDITMSKFLKPYTAENHYEPPRYFLINNNEYPSDFGAYESV